MDSLGAKWGTWCKGVLFRLWITHHCHRNVIVDSWTLCPAMSQTSVPLTTLFESMWENTLLFNWRGGRRGALLCVPVCACGSQFSVKQLSCLNICISELKVLFCFLCRVYNYSFQMCHDICCCDIIVCTEIFNRTESSLSNHKIRAYERCEPACVGTAYHLNDALFK